MSTNATHGQKRTNKDKRLIVERALMDEEWVKYSDREIARHCGVGYDLVRQLRKKLTMINHSDKRTYITKDGGTAPGKAFATYSIN